MTAVLYRLRAELRTRWRAWLGLALITGLAVGAVMAFAAGARRTDSAYSRFLDAHNAYDVAIINYPPDGSAVFDFDRIASLPAVADSARGSFEYYTFEAGNVLSRDGRIGTDINRFKIREGRALDPDRPDEMLVAFVLAEEHGLDVGDTVELLPDEFVEWLESPDTVEYPFPEEDPTADEIQARLDGGQRLLDAVPGAEMRIVGIEASPGEFPPQFAVNRPLVHLSPALIPHLTELDDTLIEQEILLVRLRGGSDAVDEFIDVLERRSRGRELQVISQPEHAAAVERSIRFQTVALWLLAALAGMVALLVVGQLLARLTYLESVEQPVMRQLGMAPAARLILGVLRAAAIAAFGSVLGIAIAFVGSTFFPTGLARTAEPDPGFDIDPTVVLLGVGLAFVLLTALGVWPAWRASRLAIAPGERGGQTGSSYVGRALAGRRIPASAGVGVRMALEPGRGRSAVPVGTTLAGVIVGVGALVAALTFGASLARLLETPRLYGVTWDFELVNFGGEGEFEGFGRDAADLLRADERVEAAAQGSATFSGSLDVDGERVDGLALESIKGDLSLPILEGRAPSAPNEVALGVRTLRSIGGEIGDSIQARTPGTDLGARLQIVGAAVFPTASERAQLGEGALVTPEGAARFEEEEATDFGFVIRLAPGADGEALIEDFSEELDVEAFPFDPGEPSDIVNFGRVEAMPFVLGGVLAAIAAATLTHLLLSAARRRRGDLALLKALGFVRSQVAGSVSVQATTVVAIGLLVGVPLGVALGRVTWTLMAENLGVVASPAVPVLAIAILVMAALVLANVIAFIPARIAARTPAATVLKAE